MKILIALFLFLFLAVFQLSSFAESAPATPVVSDDTSSGMNTETDDMVTGDSEDDSDMQDSDDSETESE